LPMSSVALAPPRTMGAPPSAVALFWYSVPSLIVTGPPKLLLPDRVRTPPPSLVSPPLPESAFASVTSLPLVSKTAPPDPIPLMRDERSSVVPVAHCRPPPSSTMLPWPRLPPSVKLIRPPVISVPPA